MSISSISSAAYAPQTSAAAGGMRQLTPAEQQEVQELAARDQKVRQHEQAHMAAAAGLAASGASYSYQQGPDGKRYAIGGEVSIDTSPGSSPQQTIARARQIRAAALAPADPSGQDRQVAAAASRMEAKAREAESAASTQGGAQTANQHDSTGKTQQTTSQQPDANSPIGSQIDTYA